MIIRSVRLKNIKSYGAGATGEGVTVRFEPGVNRIAGRNGHGKSTLIEAIGYAPFFLLCTAIALPGMILLWWVAPWGPDPVAQLDEG